jgi:5-methylcytosine-specific restriction enzyme subunit McrC
MPRRSKQKPTTMLPLRLREYETKRRVELTVAQRDQLAGFVTVQPTAGEGDLYDLTPGSRIGAMRLDGLDVVIEPKVPIDRVFFMLSYALGRIVDYGVGPELEQSNDLVEAIVQAFVRHSRRALEPGVLQGYRTTDDTSLTLRGRLRIGDQIRRRYGTRPPAEITFDDFTVDIEVNRLLLAATDRLLRIRLRSARSRVGLRGIEARLDGVQLVAYDSRRLPSITFNRLNERYRDAVTLAKFILRSTSFDLGHGLVPASSFLVDMNKVFEDFLVVALREAMSPLPGHFVQGSRGHPLYLDAERTIKLEPDLSLWVNGSCVWIGDAKYKRVVDASYPNADLYQVTAYAIATGLDEATLIYARSEGEPGVKHIVNVGKTITAVGIDLTAPPQDLLSQVSQIANSIIASTSVGRLVA